MAVMTMSLKQPDLKSRTADSKKSKKKSLEKCRPITATLDHPLVLDIKLLQKLDMTTFTKRGLIALSKFCGISLITKNGSKIKLNQCIKAIQGSKKQLPKNSNSNNSGGGSGGGGGGGSGSRLTVKEQVSDSVISETVKYKRSSVKPKISRYKPQVNFKFVEVETGGTGREDGESQAGDEEDSDVVCRNDGKLKTRRTAKSKHKSGKKPKETLSLRKKVNVPERTYTETIEVVPEPCKSCTRSQQPERLHSHPKLSVRGMMEKRRLEERFKTPLKSNDAGVGAIIRKTPQKANLKGRNPCAKGSTVPQKDLLTVPDGQNDIASLGGSPKTRRNSVSSVKSVSSFELVDVTEKKKPENGRPKKIPSPSPLRASPNSEQNSQETHSTKKCNKSTKEDEKSTPEPPGDDALKYVTGCYICGAQVSPKARMQHERDCITEWRSHNSVLAPEDRKPEPRRPDYRFTVTGDVDFNGTFESIWANHMDSLVPCKFCGRKFFPDRIERHENCCNNLSLRVNFKH